MFDTYLVCFIRNKG